ncbi:MAG: hypothetical protein PHP97_00565 [Candidatus Shapirobacteria bacterium]|nr:hypothetical protein [Candidatus Shapirobacteria bacterium]MDD3002417.1 hypothetical protein [Candidatus Shapirobacteria bacterium]MDD4383432.1 hypothetical protein [Candidatus Shapirobacteria bacterium]
MLKKVRKFLNRRQNLRIIIDLLGAIAIWWGIWGILDLFVFPENHLISYIVSITLGFILLLIDGNGLDDLK